MENKHGYTPTLAFMCKWALKRKIPLNPILDMWNSNKDKLISYFHESMDREIENEVMLLGMKNDSDRVLDDFFSNQDMLSSRIESNSMKEELKVVRKYVKSLKNEVTDFREDGKLVVDVKVYSTFSTHVEHSQLIFNEDASPDDEGVLNSIDSVLSELSYYYLLNV